MASTSMMVFDTSLLTFFRQYWVLRLLALGD
jgi:hypothetical protein